MSDKTGIEWPDATWNPVTGCAKVSAGCKNCYALRDWARLSAMPNTVYHGREFTDVQCHPERLEQPLRWTKPRRIFVNSMSDLFHPDVPDDFIDRVFAVMSLAPQHTFQVLTKRPERMREYMNATKGANGVIARICKAGQAIPKGKWWHGAATACPYSNVWLGVSVENQMAADERIPLLLKTPAAVRWVSAEPLLGPVDLKFTRPTTENDRQDMDGFCSHITTAAGAGIKWVVVGGESGPHARPMHLEWVRSLRDQCAVAGVPFLFKQWGDAKFASQAQRDSFVASGFCRAEKKGGRLLDGVLHDGYPEVKA